MFEVAGVNVGEGYRLILARGFAGSFWNRTEARLDRETPGDVGVGPRDRLRVIEECSVEGSFVDIQVDMLNNS